MLSILGLSYQFPAQEKLLNNLHFFLDTHQKAALVGNNGSGKSTLLKIIAGKLEALIGNIHADAVPYYIPQIFGQFDHLTLAQALGIDAKLNALLSIEEGSLVEENWNVLNDDWTIEERSKEALEYWGLKNIDLQQSMSTLSGGQKTKVFLAGIIIHQPQLILLDEPSNYLDLSAKSLLRKSILDSKATILMVSHDRTLLNTVNTIFELSNGEVKQYGGNYDFYYAQKQLEYKVLEEEVQHKTAELKKAKAKEREIMERKQKLDARGKQKQVKSGMPTIMLNTLRNNAEKSTSKLKSTHQEKMTLKIDELKTLRNEIPDLGEIKLAFKNSKLHKGKMLFKATGLNWSYQQKNIWPSNRDIEITSDTRLVLKGENGSGKTTLIKLFTGEFKTDKAEVYKNDFKIIYIDQEYKLIQNDLTVFQQLQQYNDGGLLEHELKIRLSRFLFSKDAWDKRCSVLSGGEKMRLILCCITIASIAPDVIILDEPTNNLDLQNIEILTQAISSYQGALIVVSHDEYFLSELGINKVIQL